MSKAAAQRRLTDEAGMPYDGGFLKGN